VFENDSNKQQAVTPKKWLIRMLSDHQEILKEKKLLSCRTSVFDFFKSSTGTCVPPSVLLDFGGDDPDDLPTIQVEVPPF
jgi:hypothetical protein